MHCLKFGTLVVSSKWVGQVPGRWECVCNFYPCDKDCVRLIVNNELELVDLQACHCKCLFIVWIHLFWTNSLLFVKRSTHSGMYKAVTSVNGHCVIQSPWKCNAGTLLKTKSEGPQTIELRVAENALVRSRGGGHLQSLLNEFDQVIRFLSFLWILYFLRLYMQVLAIAVIPTYVL